MVSTVQQRRRGQAGAGNDGDEADAGAAGVEREAHCFMSADVQAFFAQHEAEQTHLLAKQSQALNFDFFSERALDGEWQWQPISVDGFTPRRPDAVSPVEGGTAATLRSSVVVTPTKCGRTGDSDLYTRTPAIKARKRARGDVEPLKLSLTLRSSAKACSP